MFAGCGFFDDFYVFESPEQAVPYMDARSIPFRSKSKKLFDLVFMLCSDTYLKFLEAYDCIKKQLASALIVLRDTVCRTGCGFVADRFPFHGCCTCKDKPEEIVQCLARITDGDPAVTASAKHFLDVDHERKVLKGKDEHRIETLHGLQNQKFTIFRFFLAGDSFEDIAERCDLSETYVKKVMYLIRKHFNVQRFSDLFALAKEWGFVD